MAYQFNAALGDIGNPNSKGTGTEGPMYNPYGGMTAVDLMNRFNIPKLTDGSYWANIPQLSEQARQNPQWFQNHDLQGNPRILIGANGQPVDPSQTGYTDQHGEQHSYSNDPSGGYQRLGLGSDIADWNSPEAQQFMQAYPDWLNKSAEMTPNFMNRVAQGGSIMGNISGLFHDAGPFLGATLGLGSLMGGGLGSLFSNFGDIGSMFAENAASDAGIGGLSAADTLGLQQMGEAAGLSGSALEQFVNAGGMSSLGGGNLLMSGGGPNPVDVANSINAGDTPLLGNGNQMYNPLTGGLTGGNSLTNLLKNLVPTNSSGQPDYARLAGTLGSGLLGYLGSEAQSNAAGNTADKYLALGAPYRGMLQASYDPSFNYANTPDMQNAGNQAMSDMSKALSAKFGNPAESNSAQGELLTQGINRNLSNLNTYRSQLGGFGQLGINTAGTADLSGINSAGGGYDAAGYALSQLTKPANPYQDLFNQYIKLNNGSGL